MLRTGVPIPGVSQADHYHGCVTEPAPVEQTFPSTTYAWKKVKVSRGAAGQGTARRRRSGFLRLARADRSRPVRVTVTYRGGAESWWWVEARGEKAALPGHWSFDDVMARILSER